MTSKAFSLLPSPPMLGQRRGDAFQVGITREAGDASDTCGVLWLHAIDIRYTVPE